MIDKKDDSKEDIQTFQNLQQQLQMILMQKQNIQAQKSEVENALSEINKVDEKDAYEVVGNIMVKKSKKELIESLEKKKEMFDLRLKTIEKQQSKLSEKATEIQEKISKNIK